MDIYPVEHAMSVVGFNGRALQYLPKAHRANMEVVLAAVASCWTSVEHAHKSIKSSPEHATRVVATEGLCLRYLLGPAKFDRNVLETAVRTNGSAFMYVPVALRTRDLLMLAIDSSPTAVLQHCEYMYPDPRDDFDVVRRALRKNGNSLDYRYASPRLRADPTIAALALRANGWCFHYAPPVIQHTSAMRLQAIASVPSVVIHDGPEEVSVRNRGFVMQAVAMNGCVLQHTPGFAADPEVVRAAIGSSPFALQFAAPSFTISDENEDVVLKAIAATHGTALKWCSLQNLPRVFAAVGSDQSGTVYKNVHPFLRRVAVQAAMLATVGHEGVKLLSEDERRCLNVRALRLYLKRYGSPAEKRLALARGWAGRDGPLAALPLDVVENIGRAVTPHTVTSGSLRRYRKGNSRKRRRAD